MPRSAIRRVDLAGPWRSCRSAEDYSRRARAGASSRKLEKLRIEESREGGDANAKAGSSDPISESRVLQPHPRVVCGAAHRQADPDGKIIDKQNERGADEHAGNESARVSGSHQEH